ncbi:uncharacterized protein LOC143703284 [Siphateles boraxobius]|uniref:uncharacterized protein LOC143703284 n=1 Tax=Siphateles boraxobius TaxID=180520 RepID=UPI0040633277
MLQQRSQQFGRSGNICGNVFQKAFLELTYCRHEREKLCGIDHFSCPACTPDTVTVSTDGNRNVYRFNKTKRYMEKASVEHQHGLQPGRPLKRQTPNVMKRA